MVNGNRKDECSWLNQSGVLGACVEGELEGEPNADADRNAGVWEQAAHSAWSRTARQSTCLQTGLTSGCGADHSTVMRAKGSRQEKRALRLCRQFGSGAV